MRGGQVWKKDSVSQYVSHGLGYIWGICLASWCRCVSENQELHWYTTPLGPPCSAKCQARVQTTHTHRHTGWNCHPRGVKRWWLKVPSSLEQEGRKQGLMPVWTHTDTNTAEWLHKLECTCINVSKRKHTHTHTSTTGCSCTRSASTLAAILSAASQINSLNRAVRYCMV